MFGGALMRTATGPCGTTDVAADVAVSLTNP